MPLSPKNLGNFVCSRSEKIYIDYEYVSPQWVQNCNLYIYIYPFCPPLFDETNLGAILGACGMARRIAGKKSRDESAILVVLYYLDRSIFKNHLRL